MSFDFVRYDVEVKGMHISALERVCEGQAVKAPIVLLHGLVAEAATFKQLMLELPADRRVVAIDTPGSGYSDHPHDACFAALAAVIGETLRKLDLQGAVLLGHSHGGVVALQLASSETELLRGMILLCPAHPFSGKEDGLVRFYLSLPGNIFAYCLPLVPRPLLLFAFRRMPGKRSNFGYEALEPYVHTLRRAGTVKHMLGLLRSWRTDMRALRQAMQKRIIDTPTLLLWGNRDIVVPVSSAQTLMKHLGETRLVQLSGVGHMPNEEAPEETGAAIRAWLEEQDL